MNNELLEDNDFIYSYTTNGELSQKVSKETGEQTIYSWSIEGKLLSVVVKDSLDLIKTTIQYKYDGLDRRISKTVNGVTTKFIYDNENIVAELDGEDNLQALYLHGPGVDDPIMMARDVNHDVEFEETELFFFSKDHLGSVHELTDVNMKPIQRYNYQAYGETKIEKVDGVDRFVKNPYAYTSREWEEETGDYYYRARYYDPRSGRFLSLDPIGFLGKDANLYRYVGNSPISMSDPTGLLSPHEQILKNKIIALDIAIRQLEAEIANQKSCSDTKGSLQTRLNALRAMRNRDYDVLVNLETYLESKCAYRRNHKPGFLGSTACEIANDIVGIDFASSLED